MRTTELLRLVWLNVNQNKFKSVMTSISIVVGAATIVMVIAIGRGGQMDVAEQFSNLNAGAINVSYEWTDDSQSGFGNSMGGIGGFFNSIGNMFGGGMPGGMSGRGSGNSDSSGTSGRSFGGMNGGQMPNMQGGSTSDASGGFGGFRDEMPEGFGGDVS